VRVAIYGAGAIGALLGARLAEAGCDVSLIARGEHLAAIRRDGLRIISDEFGDQT
jgi:2-dehydropantoate 2-reductase